MDELFEREHSFDHKLDDFLNHNLLESVGKNSPTAPTLEPTHDYAIHEPNHSQKNIEIESKAQMASKALPAPPQPLLISEPQLLPLPAARPLIKHASIDELKAVTRVVEESNQVVEMVFDGQLPPSGQTDAHPLSAALDMPSSPASVSSPAPNSRSFTPPPTIDALSFASSPPVPLLSSRDKRMASLADDWLLSFITLFNFCSRGFEDLKTAAMMMRMQNNLSPNSPRHSSTRTPSIVPERMPSVDERAKKCKHSMFASHL